ncbi:MAG: CBS domain-containing protein [Deltaproteobacteria bacterium]|nr:CBS domain-containing protein [Deltaproteobacteria bacterium]
MAATQFERGKKVVTIEKNARISEARAKMTRHNIRHLPVVDSGNRLIGMVSDRDIRSATPYPSDRKGDTPEMVAPLTIADIMVESPYHISTRHTLQDVLLLFESVKVGAFPIVDDDRKIIGIISDRDMLTGFIQLLGGGKPGCFMGVEAPANAGAVSQATRTLSDHDISITSMLVLRDWKEGRVAIFLYLLTKNIRQARQAMTGMGFELLNPMQWFLHRFQADINNDPT